MNLELFISFYYILKKSFTRKLVIKMVIAIELY